MSSASHCRDGDMAFVAHGHLVLVIATSRVPRRAYVCHMHLPRRDDEFPTENNNVLAPAATQNSLRDTRKAKQLLTVPPQPTTAPSKRRVEAS